MSTSAFIIVWGITRSYFITSDHTRDIQCFLTLLVKPDQINEDIIKKNYRS